eukprot:807-Heterococcus_DN1.PRE.1
MQLIFALCRVALQPAACSSRVQHRLINHDVCARAVQVRSTLHTSRPMSVAFCTPSAISNACVSTPLRRALCAAARRTLTMDSMATTQRHVTTLLKSYVNPKSCSTRSVHAFCKEFAVLDEGGRQAHVQIDVRLISQYNSTTLPRLPIQLQLVYETHVVVHNQEILTLVQPSMRPLEIDESGELTLRIRIEEVSKNHRSQKFRLVIAADTSRLDGITVAPAYSNPIMVLSKRKDRKRKAEAAAAAAGETVNQPPRKCSYINVSKQGAAYAQQLALQQQQQMQQQLQLQADDVPEWYRTRDEQQQRPVSPYASTDASMLARAADMLLEAEWTVIGFSLNAATGKADSEMPIERCFRCRAVHMGGK